MKVMILKEFGGVNNFELADMEMPQPGKGEVLVRTRAIGINPIDIKTREGEGMASAFKDADPMILGWDISGTVEQLGESVSGFDVHDEVFGTINFPGIGAAYAEYVVAPADQIAKKPSSISHAEAAAATLSALTAWQALMDAGKIKAGDKVLIHGAAGGVGNYAVQIARHVGAYVVGTASGDGLEFVRKLGANRVIDYRKQRFEEVEDGFDFILDPIGGENFVRSLSILRPEGTIVLLPSDKTAEAEKAAQEHHVRNYRHILMHSSGEGMRGIASMIGEGSMNISVDKTFPFARLPEAHEALENGSVKGKVVVTLS